MTYTLPELAAGKFSALLARTVARDRFDAVRLLEMDADLIERPEFRTAFACSMAGAREDARKIRGPLPSLDAQDVRNRLVPLLRQAQEPMAGNAADWRGIWTARWQACPSDFCDGRMESEPS